MAWRWVAALVNVVVLPTVWIAPADVFVLAMALTHAQIIVAGEGNPLRYALLVNSSEKKLR
jgi:hypothetical protein